MIKNKFRALPFSCPNCGSFMVYKIGTSYLECINCKSKKAIDAKLHKSNKEYLNNITIPTIKSIKKIVDCPGCGVDIEFGLFKISQNCPYCKTPLVTKTLNQIDIKAILPFFIDKQKAKNIFKDWLGNLWFAPNNLSNLKYFEHNFTPIYLPYFSFDANTISQYKGERGDAYYVRVQKEVIINGRREIVNRMERRIRWSRVQGVVHKNFKNILINAKKDLPSIIKKISNFDLNRLLDFNPSFLSGYESFEYNEEINKSYIKAKEYMNNIIYDSVLWDIGGDEQRVDYIKSNFSEEKFELILLPIWISSYKYKNKIYNIGINGLNGEIVGERPYSLVKIIILISFVLLIVAIFVYLEKNFSILEKLNL